VNLLLDTHALIWYYEGNPKLTAIARQQIDDPTNTKFVSPASYWEIAIKLRTGRLALTEQYADFVQHSILDNGFVILPIEFRHTTELVSLPLHHRDPFDRLLVAQAIVEDMPLISSDPTLDAYPIRRIW
jgi:PIN domain nuclease of toxin-antitoxin system